MYALINNGQVSKYPYWISDFRKDKPNISLPQEPTKSQLEEQGIFEVADSSLPEVDCTKVVDEINPTLINGKWTRTWKIRDASQAEQESKKILIKDQLIKSTQERLDNFAQSKGYDNILSATTYATSTVAEYQKDGQCAVEVRDSTWNKLFQIFSDVDAGKRSMPINYSQIESELPPLSWK